MLRFSSRARSLAQGFRCVANLHSSPPAADEIFMKGLVFHGYHGVLDEERSLGQKFVVNVNMATCLKKAGISDDLNDTINYAAVYEDIKHIVEGQPRLLIESVAESIAGSILSQHGSVRSVTVQVSKPHVAVSGVVDCLGVEITRSNAAAQGGKG